MKPASRNTSKTVTTNCRSTATNEVARKAVVVMSNIARNTLEIVKTQTAAVQEWQTSVHK